VNDQAEVSVPLSTSICHFENKSADTSDFTGTEKIIVRGCGNKVNFCGSQPIQTVMNCCQMSSVHTIFLCIHSVHSYLYHGCNVWLLCLSAELTQRLTFFTKYLKGSAVVQQTIL